MRTAAIISLLLCSVVAFAGGPLVIGGPTMVSGQAFKWNNATPVTYWTDQGNLGTLTKTAADQFTAQMFSVWTSTPGVHLSTSQAGTLATDITGANVLAQSNNPNSEINTKTAIIYDVDGSVTDALLGAGASNSILGFAGPTEVQSDGISNNFIAVAHAVLNGKWIDGINNANNPEIAQDKFKEAFVHEFGHLLGLHHSQINVEVADSLFARTADNLAGLPIMFPFLLNTPARPTLSTDDIAQIQELYPAAGQLTTTGRITGRILFSDGLSAAQGYNVVARRVDDPSTPQDESRIIAVSSVSGFRFTDDAGNPAIGNKGDPFGSRDTTVLGEYEIVGLPPGNYTVQVEAIDPDFVDGSNVGPFSDFQFPMLGACTSEFFNTNESNIDSCADSSQITVGAGAVISGTDIILNNTPPTFDAWEGSELRLDRAPLADVLGNPGGVA
jgi:hypothetical protein